MSPDSPIRPVEVLNVAEDTALLRLKMTLFNNIQMQIAGERADVVLTVLVDSLASVIAQCAEDEGAAQTIFNASVIDLGNAMNRLWPAAREARRKATMLGFDTLPRA